MRPGEAFEKTRAGNPAFAEDHAGGLRVAVEEVLEVLDNILMGRVAATGVDHLVGEIPVVIETSAVLPFLNFGTGGFVSGEVENGGLDGGSVGFGYFDEDSVHIENDEVFSWVRAHQIFSSSARTWRACSLVPTVMRTPPGIS